VADVALLSALPPAAHRQLYRVLGPCLGEAVPTSVDAQIDELCRELHVEAAVMTCAIRASRFLLRQAAMLDLSEAAFAEDLAALGDTGTVRATLAPGYDMAKQVIRSELTRGALADHGKVVERVAWRVDQVSASNRGDRLSIPIGVMTLVYRDGEREDRVTLQLPPDAMHELRAMCERYP
jgi:hypothetical protein